MKQWFRGDLEAHYEGVTSAMAMPSRHAGERPFQIRIYRAQVRRLELIDPPAHEDPSADAKPPELYQARVEHARLENVNARGICLEGPIFELRLLSPRLTHKARLGDRIYGRLVGSAVGCFELPPAPPPDELRAALATSAPTLGEDEVASNGEPALERPHSSDAVEVVPLDTAAAGSSPEQPGAHTLPSSQPDQGAPALPARARRNEPASLPLLALMVGLALSLLVTTGAALAALWCAFVVPTLLVRRFLRGVLPDATAFRAIGACLSAAQLCWVSWTLLEWVSAPCKELHVIPLIGLVAGVFLAGILPYALPVALNAVGFALVLWTYGAGPGQPCGVRPAAPESAAPSVKHPGVPRTNEDGSWPRQPGNGP